MREKDFYKQIPKRCTEPTKFKQYGGASVKAYPTCLYYDLNTHKCSLNACIKNLQRKEEQ